MTGEATDDGSTTDESVGEAREAVDEGPEAVLRSLVEQGIDCSLADLDDPVDVVDRGDDPGPTDRLPALVAGGDSTVGVVPTVEPSLARQVAGDGVGDGSAAADEIRLVFTGSASERLTGPSGAAIRTVLADRGVDAYVHDGDSPVGVLLVGERVVVGLFDDGGLAALLWSEAPAIREWAAATCGRYLDAAERA